jgi:protease I
MELKGKKAAVLIEDIYQEMEVWYPVYRLREAGATVKMIGPEKKVYKSKLGYEAAADAEAAKVKAADFDVIVIPGGYAPDRMRVHKSMVKLVADGLKLGKCVAAICHGGWMLCSAGGIKGRTVTGYIAIKDDLVNAGAKYVDKEVVVDGNLITSRKPDDLPAFCRAIIEKIR